MSKVLYDGAAPAALASTPVDVPGPPAAEKHPWECDHPEWLELYRYFAFLQTDVDGNAIQHDTEEPPRTQPDEQGKSRAKTYMEPGKFDAEKHGATHYTTTPPKGSEVVFQCTTCYHAQPVPLNETAVAKLAERYDRGELQIQHFSQSTLKDLLGTEPTPGTVTLPTPTIPKWLPEQKTMLRRIAAGLSPVEDSE